MNSLRETLLGYKELTDKLLLSIEEEDEENFLRLIEAKQDLIDSINQIGYDPKMFSEISKELGLLEQDKKLHQIIEEKKLSIKEEIKKINDKKNAATAYNNTYRGFNLINKKI
ncbi:hypothetical protein [Clostridium folliculivorans]|uniref:Flagellar protein FliT n=1 Tax=Clostridium folliculivorans TaxID=2886038 RepID=A0A9W5XZ27_9CLOT|nr:hypothetical protein [Clostridium folliculivorans]GKU23560.1 hypothetical protein CFOLD11_03860 [Clostridium folliculivorans]GKU29676.1 hypothetical protein CFB3_17830 [Clostridium folliculivorans]